MLDEVKIEEEKIEEELHNLLREIDNCVCHACFISKNFKSTREISLVITKLQEAFMWAEKLLDLDVTEEEVLRSQNGEIIGSKKEVPDAR